MNTPNNQQGQFKAPEQILKDRFKFYDPNVYGKDVELNGETVIELMEQYHAQFIQPTPEGISHSPTGARNFIAIQILNKQPKLQEWSKINELNSYDWDIIRDAAVAAMEEYASLFRQPSAKEEWKEIAIPKICADCGSTNDVRKWETGANFQCHECYKDDKYFEEEYR